MIPDSDTRSRSATDCIRYLEGEDLPSDELAFWRYLSVKARRYPWKYIPPFRKPKGSSRVRRLLGCRIRTGNDASGQPVPRVLHISDGASDVSVVVGDGSNGADAFANLVLAKANRSAFVIFANGGRVELRLIAQRWGQRLMELGFTIDVLMGGSKLKALIVKKDRHRWYLADWSSVTGLDSRYISSLSARTEQDSPHHSPTASTVCAAAVAVQQLLLTWFGTGLSLTISATGLRAAARQLSDTVVKFKPAPMLVAMCREGGAFRGGLVYGARYRGPSWLIDINRAYTAALSFELPWRAALGKCDIGGGERRGVFMCRITGRAGLAPVYLSRWTGSDTETSWWRDPESQGCLALLPTVEIDGIRAIGYTVEPSWGMVYARTFSLRSFVERILACCHYFGFGSVQAKITKLLGNSIYGKFAADPTRRDLRLSLTRPGRDWLVFVDDTGYPVDDLWERDKTTYQWSQHIEVAADITARVRGQIYEAQAKIESMGGQVAAVSTDAIVSTIDPGELLATDPELFGRFRVSDADSDGIVAGPNAYAIGEKIIVPDYPDPPRDAVVSLFSTYTVDAETERSGAPRPGAPLSWKIRKRITMPASGPRTTTDRQVAGLKPSALAP